MKGLRALFAARRRRGGAVVEMAIVTPLLLTLLFGIIEYGWVFTIKQAITNAAREGCRVATLEGATDEEIINTINSYLAGTGLKENDYEIIIERATQNNPFERVTIRVPYRRISLLGGFFGKTDWTIGATCTMRKEGAD